MRDDSDDEDEKPIETFIGGAKRCARQAHPLLRGCR
jgi:hypothetical protein